MCIKEAKELYDRKHQPDELPDGSLVLVVNTAQKQCKGGKLCPAWLGPYSINKHLGKGVYELKDQDGVIVRKKAIISRLKVYTPRDGKEPKDKEKKDKEKDGDVEDRKGEEDQGKEKAEEKDNKSGSEEKRMIRNEREL